MMVIGVIPARWGSTRFEGKVLAKIAGKPMIQHVWERVKKCKMLDEVLIACDDERVLNAAVGFKAKAILTSKDHSSGTDRIREAVKNINAKIVVNIQGDEPLIDPSVIDKLVSGMLKGSEYVMATLIKVIENKEEIENPNVVKVVIDDKKNALYFSRSPIPYNRDNQEAKYFKHIGIYAYKKNFLMNFKNLPISDLERIERLEQLRVIEAGYKIKTILTEKDTVGVDTKEDLEKVEKLING